MTSRERLLAALRCQAVDRIPWSPFLAYWWEHQSEALQAEGQVRFLKELGADALLRGFITPFTCSDVGGASAGEPIPGVDCHQQQNGDETQIEFETPAGKLVTRTRLSPVGNTRFVTEHPVRRREDYRTLRYLVERMVIRPNFAAVEAEIDQVGQDGLSAPLISPFGKTPFQSLLEHFVGTQQLVYDLLDYPEEVEATLAVMSEQAMRAVVLAAESPAEAFITWEDTSTTNVSPALFAKYIAPELARWSAVVHQAGKLLLHHACGHLHGLLAKIAETGVDAVESISPPPTGNVEIWEAQRILGAGISVIGGIEPVHFLTLDRAALGAYVEDLLARMNRRGYVLANSDSCPPGVSLEKFRLVTEIARAR